MLPISRRKALKFGLGAAAAWHIAPQAEAQSTTRTVLTFIHTNDIYRMGEENGRGGLARLAAVVKAERARNPLSLFTHGGDTISPSLLSGFDQGAHMIDLFNAAGLDLFVPGNHEFDFGPDVFAKRMNEAQFITLAANLRDSLGQPVRPLRDSVLMERGGFKVGFIGAAHPNTPDLAQSGDLKFSAATEAILREAKALRAAGADFIVALVHLDRAEGQSLFDLHAVDLILHGHNHDLRVLYDGKTALCESGEDALYIAVIDIVIEMSINGTERRIHWSPEFRVIDSANVKPDPAVAARVKTYEDLLAAELDIALATLTLPLDSRTSMIRTREAAMGNLIADAMREMHKTDIALVNAGAIRGNRQYPSGTQLTRRDILAEMPFGNRGMQVRVKGKALRAALENGLSQIENNAGRFPHIAGMAILYDRGNPAGQRIISVKVGDQPLDDERVYSLATTDFILRGGDGYTMLAGNTKTGVDSGGPLLASDVMAYLRKLGTVNARVEGRITQR